MNRELIHQRLEVKTWPLVNVGDEQLFGYLVAMGVFPREWGAEDGMTPYADFAYNGVYKRYRLPDDKSLKRQLHLLLREHIDYQAYHTCLYSKVWIKRTKKGYRLTWLLALDDH